MPIERFTVVTLPYSVSEDAEFHVSLFVSPQLEPDDEVGELREFPSFADWTEILHYDALIDLFDQDGPLPIELVREPGRLIPEVWKAIFPPHTPVRVRGRLDYSNRHWRTFAAAELHDAAKVMHLTAMVADPTTPPLPSRHPVAHQAAKALGLLLRRAHWQPEEAKRHPDEGRAIEVMDVDLGELSWQHGEVKTLSEIEEVLTSQPDEFVRFAMQLHRARRFYDRPEVASEYRERPRVGARTAHPEIHIPDFHERCSLLGDTPPLLRQTGLVLDLRVHDLDRLRQSHWLSARIGPRSDFDMCRPTRTLCEVVGDDLVTIPVTDTGDWRHARLRVGDENLFALLDMDPDGTALKLDRYVWSLPRLMMAEGNGDPVHAAPTALRSLGFTLARQQRAKQVTQMLLERQGALHVGADLDLGTEDVTQGVRIEVWDGMVKKWFSLHSRLVSADAVEHPLLLDRVPDEGFVEGATVTESPDVNQSPVHLHESVFGWEGWSLSAPRPGKRVRHQDGMEVVEDVPRETANPTTPLVIRSDVLPGTLPRLRYGRDYAFRAWAVDLAGNSRPHRIEPMPEPSPSAIRRVEEVLAARETGRRPASYLEGMLRPEAIRLANEHLREASTSSEPSEVSSIHRILPDPEVNREVLSRLRTRREEVPFASVPQPPMTADRASVVRRAFVDAAADEGSPFLVDAVIRSPEDMAALATEPGGPFSLEELEYVTPIRPFLRWNPVIPPAVVPRRPFSAGESLRQLVIRSGVKQDLETLKIDPILPGVFANNKEGYGYHPTCERHLVPPKTSQTEAELHGAFDEAIGSPDPAIHDKLLAVALRESGTLFDQKIPQLQDPTQSIEAVWIRLAADASVSEHVRRRLPLPEPDPGSPEEGYLELQKGEAPPPGQYVIHDTDLAILPYLPDVAAQGISLVFPDAGRDRTLVFPFGTEGFTARYAGDWPEKEPFRLQLEDAPRLQGQLDGRVLRIGLPPGDVQRFRLASSLDKDDLDLFGVWRMLPDPIRTNPDVAEAAADGWLWALTPFEDVTLVHAVQRPLEAPRPTKVLASRPGEGSTDIHFLGAVDVHGPTTEQLTAEADWTEPMDDLSLPRPENQKRKAIAFKTSIGTNEDLAILAGAQEDAEHEVPGMGPVRVHSAVHRIDDTKHHIIRYRFRAATRFKEYFDPELLVPEPTEGEQDPSLPVDDGQSVVGPVLELSIPSSAKPTAPVVHSVLPLFRWDEGTEPEQPVGFRRRRRAGVRIYLERPWYSSGENELLGVLVAPPGGDSGLEDVVSQWGSDPVWVSAPVGNRAMLLELDDLIRMTGFDDRPGDAMPVVPPAVLPLPEREKTSEPTAEASLRIDELDPRLIRRIGLISDRVLAVQPGGDETQEGTPRRVMVLGYRPQYSEARGMWYVDIAIDPGSTFWPFVRLAVARYQPDSLPGCHLSAPVKCDYVQLTPERTTSVSRTDIRHVRVVAAGPAGIRNTGLFLSNVVSSVSENRTVVARLQRRSDEIPTDLGWETVQAVEMTVRGHGRNPLEVAWVGELESPVDIPVRRPGEESGWRVTIEEWERLPGDPALLQSIDPSPIWEQRLIYADEIPL